MGSVGAEGLGGCSEAGCGICGSVCAEGWVGAVRLGVGYVGAEGRVKLGVGSVGLCVLRGWVGAVMQVRLGVGSVGAEGLGGCSEASVWDLWVCVC